MKRVLGTLGVVVALVGVLAAAAQTPAQDTGLRGQLGALKDSSVYYRVIGGTLEIARVSPVGTRNNWKGGTLIDPTGLVIRHSGSGEVISAQMNSVIFASSTAQF